MFICGENYVGWGANLHPVIDTKKYEEARCCGDCDSAVVIPTRIELHLSKRNEIILFLIPFNVGFSFFNYELRLGYERGEMPLFLYQYKMVVYFDI